MWHLASLCAVLLIFGNNLNLCWSSCILPDSRGLQIKCYSAEGRKMPCQKQVSRGTIVEITCAEQYKASPVSSTHLICSEVEEWTGQHISCLPDNCSMKQSSGPANCADIQKSGQSTSGIYYVMVSSAPLQVYCDMDTDGGGWTVFQRRNDITQHVEFDREWKDYKRGFGDLSKEFWLGLDAVHTLTSSQPMSLRIDLEDFDSNKKFAFYRHFRIGEEWDKYRLSLEGYRGDAGDDLKYHNGHAFSTKDKDNDASSGPCARWHHGAWWFNRCRRSNLNGKYVGKEHKSVGEGVKWHHMTGDDYSIKKSEMKIRPIDF